MNRYEIVFSDSSSDDINLLQSNLLCFLKNPSLAKELTSNLARTVEQIAVFPCSFPICNDPLLKAKEIRRAPVGPSILFYYGRQDLEKVFVVAFLHGKRDCASLLANR